MEAKKKEAIMACETFDDLLNAEYGVRGTAERETFESQADTFCLAECLKEQRRMAGIHPGFHTPDVRCFFNSCRLPSV